MSYDESLRSNIVKDIKKFAAFFVEKNMFIKMHMIYKRFGGDRSAGAAFQQLARYCMISEFTLIISLVQVLLFDPHVGQRVRHLEGSGAGRRLSAGLGQSVQNVPGSLKDGRTNNNKFFVIQLNATHRTKLDTQQTFRLSAEPV